MINLVMTILLIILMFTFPFIAIPITILFIIFKFIKVIFKTGITQEDLGNKLFAFGDKYTNGNELVVFWEEDNSIYYQFSDEVKLKENDLVIPLKKVFDIYPNAIRGIRK